MTELGLLALVRLMNGCYEPVTARRLVAADLATVQALLVDPCTYGGVAHVLPSSSARVIVARVHVTPRTVVRYTSTLRPNRGTTELDLALELDSRSARYRLALLLGGTRWLHQQMEVTLATISHVTVCGAEAMDAAQTTHVAFASAP
jgi:hypothetical protein